ncbi:MAG: hypothetical protein KDK25_02695 [Leptospiraceae bacterium]|nr:hypothetical protein [Leptospiraceae bacterium]
MGLQTADLKSNPLREGERREPLYSEMALYFRILGLDLEESVEAPIRDLSDRQELLMFDYFHHTAKCHRPAYLGIMDLMVVLHGSFDQAQVLRPGCDPQQREFMDLDMARSFLFRSLRSVDLEGMAAEWTAEEKKEYLSLIALHRKRQIEVALHPASALRGGMEFTDDYVLRRMNNHWRPSIRISRLKRLERSLRGEEYLQESLEAKAFLKGPCEACKKLVPYVQKALDRMIAAPLTASYRDDLMRMKNCAAGNDLESQKRLFRVLRYFQMYGNSLIHSTGEGPGPENSEVLEAARRLLFQGSLFAKRTRFVLSRICQT